MLFLPVCGTRTSNTLKRIYGGTRAQVGQFPWQVLIINRQGTAGAGALLYDNWILTAAHVIVSQLDVSSLTLKMGFVNKRSAYYHQAQAESAFIHEDYVQDDINFNHDIALIKLKQKVPITANITPVCLPGKGGRFHVNANDTGEVAGWGKTEREKPSRWLLYTELDVVSPETCTKAYANKSVAGKPLVLTENMLCAGYDEGGRDACSGDSGGPLVFLDAQTKKVFVGGIVSWGLDCGAAQLYGVYTKVSNYISWIENIIAHNS